MRITDNRPRLAALLMATLGLAIAFAPPTPAQHASVPLGRPDVMARCDLVRSLDAYQEEQSRRDQAIREQIHTLSDLEAYKQQVRTNLQQILGPWPERTPLDPVVVDTLERDGYRIEKILLQSQPGFYVPVNLYIPTSRTTPLPTLLSPLGHAPLGKAHHTADSYQAMFITLARKGYVVCAYDPLGQGEREPYGVPSGNHHVFQGYQCMPSARHLALYFIWDGIRCLDYLDTRPEVDRQRIACSGCSGGGTLTQYITALDDRIAVSVPASWIVTSHTLVHDEGLHPESWFPDLAGPHGPGTVQLLACVAPRPLLILGNQDDAEFPPESMAEAYHQIKPLYEAVGHGDRVAYASVPTPHGYWPEARRELYRFLNRWFEQPQAGSDEPPLEPEPENSLFCAPGGQVRNLPNAQTVFSLNHQAMDQLADERARRRATLAPADYTAFIRRGILQSTLYQTPEQKLAAESIGQAKKDGRSPSQVLLEYDAGFWTIADLYEPESPAAMAVVLVADDHPEASRFAAGLLSQGIRVLQLDIPSAADRVMVTSGRTRCGLGMRLLVRGAGYLHGEAKPAGAKAAAVGLGKTAALSAQMAAIVAPERLAAVAALGGLDRLESLSEEITEKHSLQMLPGALRWYDEADLAAAMAPLPLLVGKVADKRGEFLSDSQLADHYAWAIQYHQQCNGRGLRLQPGETSAATVACWLRRGGGQ
jgi:hypothetical protein